MSNCKECGAQLPVSPYRTRCADCIKKIRDKAIKGGYTLAFCTVCGIPTNTKYKRCEQHMATTKGTETQCVICGKWFPSRKASNKCLVCSGLDYNDIKNMNLTKNLGVRIRRPVTVKAPGENEKEIKNITKQAVENHTTYGRIVAENDKTEWQWSEAVLRIKEAKKNGKDKAGRQEQL